MSKSYVVKFEYGGNMAKSPITEALFVEVYNRYCNVVNSGCTDELNKLFEELHPDYKYSDDEFDSPTLYNTFMSENYQKLLDPINETNMFEYEFMIDKITCNFYMREKKNHNNTLGIYIVEE